MIAYGLYPFLLSATMIQIYLTYRFHWDPARSLSHFLPPLLLLLMLLERIVPMAKAWGMTWRSFWRDIRYLVMDGAVIGGTRVAAGWIAIRLAQSHPGPLADARLLVAVPIALLAWDLAQYALHRYTHEGEGPVARFLWRTHIAHHLPDRVYVFMHGVFHPLNAFLNAAILQAVFLGLGLSPLAAFAAMLIIDLQTILSHFNVEVRAGIFNYLFIGTELHRGHHSADPREAKNYGTVVSIWDLLFGTFRYSPGKPPVALGVHPAPGVPRSEEILRVLAYPFAPAPVKEEPGREPAWHLARPVRQAP